MTARTRPLSQVQTPRALSVSGVSADGRKGKGAMPGALCMPWALATLSPNLLPAALAPYNEEQSPKETHPVNK